MINTCHTMRFLAQHWFLLGVGWDWIHLVRRPLTGLLYQPRMIDDERGAVGGLRIGRGNRSARRKPTPVPLCPPQIPHDLFWARSQASAVGSRRLTFWAMIRPLPNTNWVDTSPYFFKTRFNPSAYASISHDASCFQICCGFPIKERHSSYGNTIWIINVRLKKKKSCEV
jgi:hypothetical protein